MKRILYIFIIAIAALGTSFYIWYRNQAIEDLPLALHFYDFSSPDSNSNVSISTTTEQVIVEPGPDHNTSTVAQDEVKHQRVNLDVPFTAQAPTANWSQPWQDACEEASILMVYHYYEDTALGTPSEVEKILADMVDWQFDNWGSHDNLTVLRTANLAVNLYGYRFEVIDSLTPDKLKQYLNQGRPVIIPANGKILDNPNFTDGGPDYHMLIVKGYMGDKFITNDPGTRLGKDFIYTSQNLFAAIADWDQKADQASGPQLGLVLYKN